MFRIIFCLFIFSASLSLLAQTCANPGQDGDTTITTETVINTYYEPLGSVSAGDTSIFVDFPVGASTVDDIAPGDLLLFIQMQDATINRSNTSSYGDGVAGGVASGTTSDGDTGLHEFVVATSTINTGTGEFSFSSTGGGGLQNDYTVAAATSTRGQRTFQIIRVPQYNDLQIDTGGSIVPHAWDGEVGGVVVIDVDGTLTFNGGAVDVSNRGFRGGGGRQLGGGSGGNDTDYRRGSANDFHGVKGEGIAGTPRYVHAPFVGGGNGTRINTGAEGYPNGSHGRGAPGNAGGGGNDGRPSANDENSGGGGGAGGGSGGEGGFSWNSVEDVGGFGGTPAGNLSPARPMMGGGGGAGTRNNGSGNLQASGGTGGGVIIIQADNVTGNGSIRANGSSVTSGNGLQPENDGGGGGGGAGTIVIWGLSGSLSNVTIDANGGDGGSIPATEDEHGPGGGGGGGAVFISDQLTVGTINLDGGDNGLALIASDPFGATGGSPGIRSTTLDLTSLHNCGSLPVTLSSFEAKRKGRFLHLEWTTATEVGNAGFQVLIPERTTFREVMTRQGWLQLPTDEPRWQPIADSWVRSQDPDSMVPRTYRLRINDPGVSLIMLEDVDTLGNTSRHGPFELESVYGKATTVESIDWQAVRAQLPLRATNPVSTKFRNNGGNNGNSGNNNGNNGYNNDNHGSSAQAEISLKISESGLYRITYQDLEALGISWFGVKAKDIAIVDGSRGVPRYIKTGRGNRFDQTSYIDVYLTHQPTLYSQATRYSLRQDKGLAVDIQARNGGGNAHASSTAFHRVIDNPNNRYSFYAPTGDPWYNTQLFTLQTPLKTGFPLHVDQLADTAGATLNLEFFSGTDYPQTPDHHIRIYLNGLLVADERFDGRQLQEWTVPVSQAIRNGQNQVEFELVADTGAPAHLVYLESIDLRYQRNLQATQGKLSFVGDARAYTVTGVTGEDVAIYAFDNARAFRLGIRDQQDTNIVFNGIYGNAITYTVAEAAALAPPAMEKVAAPEPVLNQTTDLLIISHHAFQSSLAPWLAQKEAEGWSPLVVDVTDVYRYYGNGEPDAAAIEALIAEAAESTNNLHVLIVGGDTYDYANILGQSVSYVPTPYRATHELVDFAPVDPAYGDLDQDGVPDVPVGRWPVRTPAELETVIAKTLTWQQAGLDEATIVAGADFQGTSYARLSDPFLGRLPANVFTQAIFAQDLGTDVARSQLIDAFNRGTGLVAFLGHSGPTSWSFGNLFTADDAAQLTNRDFQGLVLQWGCWNTYHVAPSYNTLAHKFLLNTNGGAAAVIGSATLTSLQSELAIAEYLLPGLYRPGVTIGQAINDAKQRLALIDSDDRRDVLLGLTLLGDPSLKLQP